MAKTNFNSHLFRFAFFPSFDQSIRFLADNLADKEEWDFSDTSQNNFSILKNYYDGKIQLLLPLCLTAGSPNPDLALVIHKLNDHTYTARTCLTLKMAYNNARLIVKPQSIWLKP